MTLTEKTAYIKGLCDGLQLDANTPEAKIINALVDLVNDMAAEIADLEADVENVYDYCDELDEDLGAVEEDLYDDEDDDDCDCCCGDDDFYEVECPACHETICLDEDMLCEGEIECPNCGTDLEFDFDDECDCCCDCCDEGEEE